MEQSWMMGILACVASLVVGCGSSAPHASPPEVRKPVASAEPAAASAAPDWRIVNVMPAWWGYWDKAQGKPRNEQVRLFEQEVVARHPSLFTAAVVGRGDPSAAFDLKERIATFLEQVEPHVATMRRLSESIEQELPAHRKTFMDAFPEFTWGGKVFFTVSLDAFDGAVREVDGEAALLFGVDKIARLHGSEAALAPLFHHELFHILHLVQGTPFDPRHENRMYQALWSEGLAVHVAHELNPGATMQQLVLSDAMVEQGTRQLSALAEEMLANIDSQDPGFYRDWFRSAGTREDIPNRVGYFLGFRVAQRVGQERSLGELAAMKDPRLREAIARALRELAGK